MSYVSDVAMFTVWLVSRGCMTPGYPAGCLAEDNGALTSCTCKTDLCNTGVHQSVIGRQIIVSCVTVTAVVGHIFYY